MIQLVDSHCHLDRIDLTQYGEQLDKALDHAAECGVTQFLCIATDQDNFDQVKAISETFPQVHCTVGVHPLSSDLSTESMLSFLLTNSKHPKVVGIGETGLDHYYAKETYLQQRESFIVHIEAARQTSLPLVVHTREAKQETLALLKPIAGENPGVLHCFTEDWGMAKQALDWGFYISISGIVTFKQAENVREVAKKIPLDRLLVETDAPYLAPVPFRGKPCVPAYTRNTAEFLADLRGEPMETLAQQTTENYHRLFQVR